MTSTRPGPGAADGGPGFHPVIVGSDIGVYGLARSFHEQYGLRTTVVAFAEPGPIAHSRLIDPVLSGTAATEIVATLERVATDRRAAGHRDPLLLQSNMDWVVRILAHHRTALESAGYVLPYADVDLIDRICDKAEFSAVCADLGIPTPATVIQDFADAAADDWQPEPVGFDYPVIAKPASSADYHEARFAGKKKIYEITSPGELDRLYAALRGAGFRGRFLVQEMIPGDDTQMRSVTTYSDTSGRVTLRCSARVLLEERTPAARGNPSAMIVEPIDEILDAAQRLCEHTGWRGFANFDVKLDPRDGVYKFFEQNPRIGRNNYYLTAGGQNPTEVLVDDVIRGQRRTLVTATREVLYAVVPHRLLRRYVLDDGLRARVVGLMRTGRTVHPLRYAADGAPRRRLYVLTALVNHVRKYRRYYPTSALKANYAAAQQAAAARPAAGRRDR
ncbi:carboxylate--amine ligase [Isoptericola aurantiacus]|uniref:carboxylate--amine ligase n=1 Tax=Isoptericola aurantiacus TaxID=3377839 RepID=UPI00383BCFBB